METGHTITTTKQHMTDTLISLEDCLRNQSRKGNRQPPDKKLSDLTDRFTKIYDKQLNKMKMGRKDTESMVIQPTENMDTVCNATTTQ